MNAIFSATLKVGLFSILFVNGNDVMQHRASDLIHQSISYTLSLNDFSADFQYSVSQFRGPTTEKKGVITFKKGKYVVITPEAHVYFNGDLHKVYLPDQKIIQTIDLEPMKVRGIFQHMYTAFTGPAEYFYEGDEKIENIVCHKIRVVMKTQDAGFSIAYLWLKTDTKFPSKARFIDLRNTITEYAFLRLKPNQGFSDQFFELDVNKYLGAKFVDED